MPTIIPTFTVIPSPTDTRQQFSTHAFQVVAEWNGVITAMNAQSGENNATAAAAAGSASASAASATDSANSAAASAASAGAADSARIAAEVAASNASATAGATAWVSGKAYTAGEVVWSTASFLTYRRRTNGGGTTDPADDAANWEPLVRDTIGNVIALPSGTTAGTVYATHVFDGMTSVVTLPASPLVGHWLGFASSAAPASGQYIDRSGNLIGGVAQNLVIDTRMPFRLVFSGPTKGWVLST